MKARKIGLLILILCFGAITELVYQVHSEFSVGPTGCRVISGKFHGPSHSFEEERQLSLTSPGTVEVDNAFGAVEVRVGEPGEAKVSLRKVVYLASESEARRFAEKLEIETEQADSSLKVSTNRRRLERQREHVGFETHLTLAVPPGTDLQTPVDHRAEPPRHEVEDDEHEQHDRGHHDGVAVGLLPDDDPQAGDSPHARTGRQTADDVPAADHGGRAEEADPGHHAGREALGIEHDGGLFRGPHVLW